MEKLIVGCEENEPDCEHCKYPDCIATYRDVFRQDRYKQKKMDEQRDREIIKMRNQGYMLKDIAKKFNMKCGTVGTIIFKAKHGKAT